jgi:hypothetical protein
MLSLVSTGLTDRGHGVVLSLLMDRYASGSGPSISKSSVFLKKTELNGTSWEWILAGSALLASF